MKLIHLLNFYVHYMIFMGSLSNSVDEEFWEGIKQLIVA